MAELQPSKLVMRVRFPSPAHLHAVNRRLLATPSDGWDHRRDLETGAVMGHVFAQTYGNPGGGGGVPAGLWVVYIAVIALYIAEVWIVFTKAGRPGWAAIIPIYNTYVLMKIAGRPGWWLLLLLIPIVNVVILIIVAIDVAKAFGKGAGFGVGLFFLPIIFYGILAWGDARYQGAARGPALPSDGGFGGASSGGGFGGTPSSGGYGGAPSAPPPPPPPPLD
jgi:Family of unknown function (DUF5684)